MLVTMAAACSTARADQPVDGGAVLQKYCARCHAGGKAEGELGFITDTNRLITEGYVVPGDASRSELVRRIAEAEMPPAGVAKRPNRDELAAVRAWVDAMPAATRPFQRWSDLDRVVAADAARLTYDARPSARWFSIAHLANTGATEVQLERYRTALATLLGSLTWSAKAPSLIAIDARHTVFRIDLRELGWTPATWDTVRASYPYGVARGSDVPEAIRGDWFVGTASRAPLYHVLLGLPDTLDDLARRLGVDLADDIARGHVARAGFNRSGVSVNNRVIERHATAFGALWRSYDFASNLGRENVFAHPLDFVPSGGEVIFNLPDGLQAYMLVDRNGKRIDRAPTAIVSDPRRPDRAVENAVSCMGCHASGIVAHADQLRDVRIDQALDRDRIRALHPRAGELTALYNRDRARFAAGLAAIGARPGEPTDEPTNALVSRYENELDLATAAAELGLRPDELAARIPRAYGLRQTLDVLTRGGTVKRDTWAALFPRIVDALGVGVPFTPRTSRDLAPPVWIDRRRHTWILVELASDQATAVGICRGRGYELPRELELVDAVATGMAAGLSLSTPAWSAGTKLDASNLRYGAVVDPRTSLARRADVTDKNAVVCVQR